MENCSNQKMGRMILSLFIGLVISFALCAQEDNEPDPLHDAALRADVDAVREALAAGADINRQSDNGYTALMWASSYSSRPEYAEVAKFLIGAGADVNVSANDGTTAVLEAAESSAEIARMLIEKGADVNARRNDGRGIFTSSVFGFLRGAADLEFIEYILSQGADVNETATSGDVEGWAPIHYAASNGQEELVRFLLKKGADVNVKTAEGQTPLSIARSNEYASIIELLEAAGAK